MTERDERRSRIVDMTVEIFDGWESGDWEKVIGAAGEIERVAGELKNADEIDQELWRNG